MTRVDATAKARRLLAELEALIGEIGPDTPWRELETTARTTIRDELGRDLTPVEEQRLVEAWVAAGRAAA